MKRQGLNQHQQSQNDPNLSNGWLQRAAVRIVPKQEVQSSVVQESAANSSFVNVPVHQNKLPLIQRKLNIGATGDTYNQETERLVDRSVKVVPAKTEITDYHHVTLKEQRPNKTGLPDHLKTGIESLSGYSMDDVRVHYNSTKPAQLQAYAYAQGTDIHIASGQEKHLPHEAWHVVQHKQGRVKPTIQAKGVEINHDQKLEIEADKKGKHATTHTSEKKPENEERKYIKTKPVSFSETLQRKIKEGGDVSAQDLRWKNIVGKKKARTMIKDEKREYTLEEICNRVEMDIKNREEPLMPYINVLRNVINNANKNILSHQEIVDQMLVEMKCDTDEKKKKKNQRSKII